MKVLRAFFLDYEGVTICGASFFCSVKRLLLRGASFALWSVGLTAVVTCVMSSCLDPAGLLGIFLLLGILLTAGRLAATRLVAGRYAACGGPLRGCF